MSGVPPRLEPLLAPDSPAQRVAAALTDAGHQCYLVGGSLRDALLDRKRDTPEYDLATDARPDAIEAVLRPIGHGVVLVGARFGTVSAIVGGVPCEVTTFRSDVYHPESRKPEVVFGDDIETDLSRRDFTVNAMALRLPDPVLVDPFNGAVDLAQHRLRTPLSPEISFTDDPLRMLRAARFIAGFGLEPVPELVAAVGEHRGRLEIVSAERIRDELSKLLKVEDPAPGLWFLAGTALSDEFLPELNAMQLEQDPIHHHKDVLAHTIAVVQKVSPDLVLRLAALLHDIGKPKTRSFEQGRASFHHHEVVGARMARERLTALRYPKDVIEDVTQLVYLHLRIHTYAMGWTDSAVRRYVRDAGPLLEKLNELQRCDCTTRNERKARALEQRMDDLEARIVVLAAEEELKAIRPPLDGRQVMEFLGVPPGPVIGDALDFLLEARLDEGPIEEAEAFERLAAWARARGIQPA
ncbi:MAG: CCA tRNA nucleotidyltransferase [Acidimicrobiia bacterium]